MNVTNKAEKLKSTLLSMFAMFSDTIYNAHVSTILKTLENYLCPKPTITDTSMKDCLSPVLLCFLLLPWQHHQHEQNGLPNLLKTKLEYAQYGNLKN